VKAPLSGIVSEKKIDPGSMAMPGMPLFTVEDTSHFKIEVGVDESLTGKITSGMEAVVLFEEGHRKVTGKITKVIPSIDLHRGHSSLRSAFLKDLSGQASTGRSSSRPLPWAGPRRSCLHLRKGCALARSRRLPCTWTV
jgi:hypothetical protein